MEKTIQFQNMTPKMYNLTIETPYNTIYLCVDALDYPEVDEILKQPWVKSVKVDEILPEKCDNGKFKRLVRRKDAEICKM